MIDRAERHDFWPRLSYSFLIFSSLQKIEGRRIGEWISKIVIKGHAFLLDPIDWIPMSLIYYLRPCLFIKLLLIRINLDPLRWFDNQWNLYNDSFTLRHILSLFFYIFCKIDMSCFNLVSEANENNIGPPNYNIFFMKLAFL